MTEITLEYLNKIADQTIMISSLLGGFSIAVIANLLLTESKSKLQNYLLVSSTLASCFFLITVFAMTNILMKTTEGYPFAVKISDFNFPRVVGILSLYLGMISLLSLIALSGWTKSKKMGVFTTTIGVITLILTLMMTG